VEYRKAEPSEEGIIRAMLVHAIFLPAGAPPPAPDIVETPQLRPYFAGWGRPGDAGWLAESGGAPIGAAWLRTWAGAERGYGFVDARTPELSIAVLPAFRGAGIGTQLLALLIADADARREAVSLSVTESNPARRLYARFGFVETARSGDSVLMVRPGRALNPGGGG
jgi:ribosomal protein S18 acetylase RimI-like enzyme